MQDSYYPEQLQGSRHVRILVQVPCTFAPATRPALTDNTAESLIVHSIRWRFHSQFEARFSPAQGYVPSATMG